jgi:hypothetical protein
MPTRSRARRNPEPPQTLYLYLLREAGDALRTTFAEAGIVAEPYGIGEYVLKMLDWRGVDYSLNAHVIVYWTYPLIEIDAINYTGQADIANIAEALANRTGRIVTLMMRRPQKTYDEMIAQGFTFAETRYGDKFAYAPRYFEKFASIGHAFARPRTPVRTLQRPWKEYLLHSVGFQHVPRKYRTQIKRLVLDALANEDLATYLQARDLAELVSEPFPATRKNPPPTYIPASARKERVEADAATLEHHKAFLSRVRALKEKYGSSWQFPELAGLTPVPYEYVPTSLGEHLLSDYAQVVGQEGVSVASPQGMGRVEYGLGFPDGSSAVVTQDPRAPLGALAVTRFAGNPRVVGAVLARAAEHTGNLVSVEDVSLAKAMSAIKHKRVGVPSLYVPTPIKNKREVADAYFALRVDAQDADALYTFAKAVREALFPRVPKEYKPKFARLVSQAFGDDALGFLNVTGAGTSSPDRVGAYRQARDLAELVSE